jgi:hypothetical protein
MKFVIFDRSEESHRDQAVPVRIRQRPEQQWIDGAECCGSCADADGDGRDGQLRGLQRANLHKDVSRVAARYGPLNANTSAPSRDRQEAIKNPARSGSRYRGWFG